MTYLLVAILLVLIFIAALGMRYQEREYRRHEERHAGDQTAPRLPIDGGGT